MSSHRRSPSLADGMRAAASWAVDFFSLSWIVLGLLTSIFSFLACVLLLPRSPLAAVGLCVHLVALAVPLRVAPPRQARRLLQYVSSAACNYFPITVEFEDKNAFNDSRPCVIGYEPHSVLPIGACVFLPYSRVGQGGEMPGQGSPGEVVPPFLRNSIMASTSSVFLVPFMRHLLYWLGCRSASREVLQQALADGQNVVLCPGGVQECYFMDPLPDQEVAFLKQRTGFVKLAMTAGAPLVPVFSFGQTPQYSYWRPFIDWPKHVISGGRMASFVRRIGFVPLLCWGVMGTTLPHRVPMHIYVGKPIAVPHTADPSAAEVQRYLTQYISAMAAIFERHKAAAGHPKAKLTII
ncbi:hypothetical protein D9Q98_005053 [Chlorella vulgaris]|uniref:Acyltransferase n=1 Tax=Chlorella vulgaris TaxID=3077 RepID=A0A9D4TNQ3_CHLVU|nr:hypothetical protein D9Q98_005053 [Chlorella vulgaris]